MLLDQRRDEEEETLHTYLLINTAIQHIIGLLGSPQLRRPSMSKYLVFFWEGVCLSSRFDLWRLVVVLVPSIMYLRNNCFNIFNTTTRRVSAKFP